MNKVLIIKEKREAISYLRTKIIEIKVIPHININAKYIKDVILALE